MPIFKLSAPETVHLLSGHILPRNASNFTHIHLDFKKFSQGGTPDPCLQHSFSRCWLPNLRNHAKFRAVRGGSRSSTLFKVIEF